MPRSLIPHGNRPRVPVGYEVASSANSFKPAPHRSRPLPAGGRSGRAPSSLPPLATAQNDRPSPHQPAPRQLVSHQPAPEKRNNMDSEDELARLRAELAALKISIREKNSAATQEADTTPQASPAATSDLRVSKHVAPEATPKLSAAQGARAPPISQTKNGSLLGQDYKPPSKERVARRTAVKIVPASTPTTATKVGDHMPLPEKTYTIVKEGGAAVKLDEKPSENQEQDCEETKQVDEDSCDNDYACTGSSSGTHSAAAEQNDFAANSGRRICISNLPVGANIKDVEELIEQKASLGGSIEKVTIFRRGNGRPGYALVDVANSEDASHIVKWMDDEHLFGWPITLRLARDLSKITTDELLDNNPGAYLRKSEAPGMDKAGNVNTCRYWLQGYCRNGAACKFIHSIGDRSLNDLTASHTQSIARRGGLARGKRTYNFSNITLPGDAGDEEPEESIFGTRVYRPTALRVVTDDV